MKPYQKPSNYRLLDYAKTLIVFGISIGLFLTKGHAQNSEMSTNDRLIQSKASGMNNPGNAATSEANTSINRSGDLDMSVPLYTVEYGSLSLPIKANYTPGIKVDQRASEIGLGWEIPFGSVKRDYGAFEPDYNARAGEAKMRSYNTPGTNSTAGKLYGSSGTSQTLESNPYDNNKKLTYDIINNPQDYLIPDNYHVRIPGKSSHTFSLDPNGNYAVTTETNLFEFNDSKNWSVKGFSELFTIDQELSRINEFNYNSTHHSSATPGGCNGRYTLHLYNSYAGAIAIPPYVPEKDFGRVAWDANSSQSFLTVNAWSHTNTVKYSDYGEFIVKDEYGVTYIFGRPLRQQKYMMSEDPFWSVRTMDDRLGSANLGFGSRGDFWKMDFIGEWLLTEVRGTNFEDLNNNGMADEEDRGDWIRIEYTTPGYDPQTQQFTPLYKEWLNYTQTDEESSLWKEKAYVKRIITPDQRLSFTTSEKYDVHHDYFTTIFNNHFDPDLNKFYVFNHLIDHSNCMRVEHDLGEQRYDRFTVRKFSGSKDFHGQGQDILTVDFNYAAKGSSDELCVSNYLIRDDLNKDRKIYEPGQTDTLNLSDFHTSQGRGKTTLLGITFTNASWDTRDYEFEYGYNPSFNEIHKAEIVSRIFFPTVRQSSQRQRNYPNFTYKYEGGAAEVINYPAEFLSLLPFDRVSYAYDLTSSQNNTYVTNWGLPANVGELKTVDQTRLVQKDQQGYYNGSGNPDADRKAWSLTKITYPTQGSMSFDYEADRTDVASCRAKWNISDKHLPTLEEHNKFAKHRSKDQTAFSRALKSGHNDPYINGWAAGIPPKTRMRTFEMSMDETYAGGLRVKKTTRSDGLNPDVVTTYEYGTGRYTAPPTDYWSNYLAAYSAFMTEEYFKQNYYLLANGTGGFHKQSENYAYHYDYFGSAVGWTSAYDNDMLHKLARIRLDPSAGGEHYYEYVKTKYADNSYTKDYYGNVDSSTFQAKVQRQMPVKYNTSGHYQDLTVVLGEADISKSIVHKKTEHYQAGQSTPYHTQDFSYTTNIYDAGWNLGTNSYQLFPTSTYNVYALLSTSLRPYPINFSLPTPFLINRTNPKLNNLNPDYWYNFIGAGGNPDVYISLANKGRSYSGYTIPAQSIRYNQRGLIQLTQEIANLHGVETTVNHSYEPTYGQLRKTEVFNSHYAEGGLMKDDKVITRYSYAHEEYTPIYWHQFKDSNMLGQVAEVARYLNSSSVSNAIGTEITAWEMDLNTIPNRPMAPGRTVGYRDEIDSDGRFVNPYWGFNFDPVFPGQSTHWKIYEDVLEFDENYIPMRTKTGDHYQFRVNGYHNQQVKAVIRHDEEIIDATYTGFEDVPTRSISHLPGSIEQQEYWYDQNGAGFGSMISFVTQGIARSGKYSYELGHKANSSDPAQKTPVRPLNLPNDPTNSSCSFSGNVTGCPTINAACKREYTVSFWVLNSTNGQPANAGTNANTGSFTGSSTGVRLVVEANASGSSTYNTRCTHNLVLNTGNVWTRYEMDIDLPVFYHNSYDVEALIYLENDQVASGNKRLFIDDLIIYPKGARYTYQSFDLFGNQIAITDENENTVKSTYDDWGRVLEVTDAKGDVISEHSYFTSNNLVSEHNYDEVKNNVDGQHFNRVRTFLDGFGQPNQSITLDPTRKMMTVHARDFDNRGNESKLWLPYPKRGSSFYSRMFNSHQTDLDYIYGSGSRPYVSKGYKARPEQYQVNQFQPRTSSEVSKNWTLVDGANTVTRTSFGKSFNAGQLLKYTRYDEEGYATYQFKDKYGRIVQTVMHAGHNHQVDATGFVTLDNSSTNAYHTTNSKFDAAGNLVATSDANGKVTTYTYNSEGLLTESVSPDKGTTRYYYDDLGRLIRSQNSAQSEQLGFWYDLFETYYKYDAYDRIIESGERNKPAVTGILQELPAHKYYYDGSKADNALGKLIKEEVIVLQANLNAPGPITSTDVYRYGYDENGRVNKEYVQLRGMSNEHRVETEYNRAGNPTLLSYFHPTQSAHNFVEKLEYDNLGRLSKTSSGRTLATLGEDCKMDYDVIGQLFRKSLSATGNSSDPYREYQRYNYNIRGELERQYAKRFKMELGHDRRGNVTSQVWNNETTTAGQSNYPMHGYTYFFDGRKRLQGADYSDITYTQNPYTTIEANLKNLPPDTICTYIISTYNADAYSLADDFFSDVMTNGLPVSGGFYDNLNTLVYLIDLNLKNVQKDYMEMSEQDQYDFIDFISEEASNEGIDLEELQGAYEQIYNPSGDPQTAVYLIPDIAIEIDVILTPDCEINKSALAVGSLVPANTSPTSFTTTKYDATYWYTANGNLDSLYRLDNLGVLTEFNYYYQSGKNRLASVDRYVSSTFANFPFTYDGNGRLASDGYGVVNTLYYNTLNELPLTMYMDDGSRNNYRYDPAGKRSVKELNGTATEFHFGPVILDQNEVPKRYTITDGFATADVAFNLTKYHQVKDWLGTVRAVVRGDGVLESVQDHYPYGKLMPGLNVFGAPEAGRYQFTGHEYDGETQYGYHGARYYQRDLGRYLAVDPNGFKFVAWSPYVYTSDNPVNMVDPDGKENIPALLWALENLVNKGIPSTYSNPYFAGNDKRWVYEIGAVPDRTVCYESCFMSYMNSGADAVKTLQTGFTNSRNAFYGRVHVKGGMNWFKEGDGTHRQFVTDITKGELGDIAFMGEDRNMEGHAVLLASEITEGTVELNGKTVRTMSFYSLSTSSTTEEDNFGGKRFTFFEIDGVWVQDGVEGGYIFRGFGQMTDVEASAEEIEEAKKKLMELEAEE